MTMQRSPTGGLESIIREWLASQVDPKLEQLQRGIDEIKNLATTPPETFAKIEKIANELKSDTLEAIKRIPKDVDPTPQALEAILTHSFTCKDGKCGYKDVLTKHKPDILKLLGVDDAKRPEQNTTDAKGEQPKPEQPKPAEQPKPHDDRWGFTEPDTP